MNRNIVFPASGKYVSHSAETEKSAVWGWFGESAESAGFIAAL